MNTQEAYTKIREYFTRPGAQLAKSETGACLYRAPSNNKCAVGCLIPDSLYSSKMEGATVRAALMCNPRVEGYLWDVSKVFLSEAQLLHDKHSKDIRAFIIQLDLLARAYALSTPVGASSVPMESAGSIAKQSPYPPFAYQFDQTKKPSFGYVGHVNG